MLLENLCMGICCQLPEISHERLVFWNSIHLEVASDSYCFLINSSWLLVLVSFVLFFELYFVLLMKSHLQSFMPLSASVFLLTTFSSIISYWFRDLLRELDKKYEVLLIIFFLLFLLFVVSEALLFLSFFWTSFHSLSSPILESFPISAFYLPDPCELTFANTLLLFNAAISLGNAFISLEISTSIIISLFFIFIFSFLSLSFISLQIKEFPIIPLSINDSFFFFLTGLHFFHLTFGLLLLSLLFLCCCFSYLFRTSDFLSF